MSALFTFVTLLAIQVGGQARTAHPGFDAAPTGAPVGAADTVRVESASTLPKQVVTNLIRRALDHPEDEEAWQDLERALPTRSEETSGTGLRTGAGVSRPGMVSDAEGAALPSLSDPTGRLNTSGGPVRVAASRSWTDLLVATRSIPLSYGLGVAGALALVLAIFRGRKRRRDRGGSTSSVPVVSEGTPATSAGSDSRAWTVRHLASSGLPMTEIARKTGLAQDALTFLLSPAATSPGSAADGSEKTRRHGGAPWNRTQCRSSPSSASRVLTAIRESGSTKVHAPEAARFRDGRLTY